MGILKGLETNVANGLGAALRLLKGPDANRAPELRQQIKDLNTRLDDVNKKIARLDVGGWSAGAKAERAKNAPELMMLEKHRASLIKDLYDAEKQLSPTFALQEQARRSLR